MNPNIQIMEKPDWVSWDEIHEVIWQAHSKNREKGIVMRYPTLPGEVIKTKIEGSGKMFVAINEKKVVATAAIIINDRRMWCGSGKYAYCCFAAVLPEMQGTGVYKELCIKRDAVARELGVGRMLMDTNENNRHEIDIVLRNGYKKIDMRFWGDHYNIVFVKWLDGCPYSDFRCNLEFGKRKAFIKSKQCVKTIIGKQ